MVFFHTVLQGLVSLNICEHLQVRRLGGLSKQLLNKRGSRPLQEAYLQVNVPDVQASKTGAGEVAPSVVAPFLFVYFTGTLSRAGI